MKLFKRIITEEKISDFKIDGFENIRLLNVIDTDAWLGPLMLMSDELSVFLHGSRIWDAYYKVDKNSLTGIKPLSRKQVRSITDFYRGDEVLSTYEDFKLGEHNYIDQYLLCRETLIKNIEFSKNKKIKLSSLSGFYEDVLEDYELIDQRIIPFQNEEMIKIKFFAESIGTWKASASKVLNNDSSYNLESV